MANLLYYLPGCTRVPTLDALRQMGLGYAFERVGPRVACKGPDGSSGMIIANGGDVGFYADRQTWRKIPGVEAWVGRDNNLPIKPDDLARASQISGHAVLLGDGNRWQVPAARSYRHDEAGELDGSVPALPLQSSIDDEGNWIAGDVVPEHRELWRIAEAFFDAFTGSQAEKAEGDAGEETSRVRFHFQGTHDAALLALSMNYRLGKAEVALLGLFTDRNVAEVLLALIDWPTFEAWFNKKKRQAADGLPTDDGLLDDGPDTGQP